MAVIKVSQIRSWPHSVGDLFTDHMVLYYTKGLCHPLSSVCHITGRRRKGKGLEVPCKYNYYCGPTKDPMLIWELVFIFVIMLILRPLNETRHLYGTGRNLRQYDIFFHMWCGIGVYISNMKQMCLYYKHMHTTTHMRWWTYVDIWTPTLQYHIWVNICMLFIGIVAMFYVSLCYMYTFHV